MERGALEDEVARLAPRRCHDQAVSSGTNAALDVTEILLEDLDRQTEIVAKIVELPLVLAQPFDDLLTASAHERPVQGFSLFSASHRWIGTSPM